MSGHLRFADSIALRRKIFRIILRVILVILILDSFRATMISAHRVESVSMRPTLEPGDRLLATPLPFGPRTILGKLPALASPGRGDLVVARVPGIREEGILERLWDTVVRLLTFQRYSPSSRHDPAGSDLTIKRVIGLPGDRIRMEAGRYMILTAGGKEYLEEAVPARRAYRIEPEKVIPGIIAGFPGSGSMAEIHLGPDEFFVSGDARSESSDSRIWGPLRREALIALVVVRYWPPGRAGRP
jgi:signal peptidase I